MPKIYSRNCNFCGEQYKGVGKQYCSHKCSMSGSIGKILEKRKDNPNLLRTLFKKGHRQSESARKKMGDAARLRCGEKSPTWKGGLTPISQKIRDSIEYKLWREAVFKRDDYTCIWCGKRGIRLNADHIKRFSEFPELRFAIDNGRTLCLPCHKTTDTWGTKGMKNHKTKK